MNKIIKQSNYTLKAIYLDHGCPYFKETMFSTYLKKTNIKRAIVKIKPEFDSWIKHGWNESQLYKGALARWERFNHIENKRNAILTL